MVSSSEGENLEVVICWLAPREPFGLLHWSPLACCIDGVELCDLLDIFGMLASSQLVSWLYFSESYVIYWLAFKESYVICMA